MTAPNDALIARIALDQAGLRQQLDQAQAQFAGFGASVKSALGVVGATLSGTFTVGAFTAWIKGAVDAADETSKLAQKVGVTVQQVAGLQLAFRQSGLDTAEFEASLGKLAKSASEGNDAFAAIGVSVKAADGSLRSTREILGDTAEQFAGMEDSAAKTAIAIELFGKSGAKLIPLLNGGAEGLRQFDAMAQSLGLTLDERTAKAAENFNDTLDLIGQAGQGVARRVTAELLPTLNSLAGTLFKNVTEGDNLKRVAEAIGVAFKGLYTVVAGVVAAFQTVGTAIGGVGAAIAAIIRGDFGQVRSIITEMSNDVRTTWAGTAQNVADVWSGANAKVVEGMTAVAGAAKRAAPVLKDLKESAAALAKQEDLRRKLLDEVSALERNSEGVEKLSDAQKLMLKIGEALRDGTVRLTDAEKANVFGRLEALDAAQRLAKANEALVKSLIDAGKEEEKRNDDRRKALGDVYAEIAAAQEKSAALALEAAGIKQTASAVLELRAAKLEYLADTEMEPGGSEERARLYRAEAAALRELAGVVRGNEIREQVIDQAKAAEDAWRSAADQIGQSLTDALVRGFESGKSVLRSVGDYIVNFFKTTIARGIAQSIGGALMAALSNSASASGGGSTFGSGANMIGNAGSILSLLTGGGTFGAAFSYGALGTLFGSGTGSMLSASGAMLGAGQTLSGIGTAVGAVAPYVAAAFAVYSIAKAIKDNGGSPGVQNYGIVGTMGLGYAGNVPNLQSATAYTGIIQPIADAVAMAVSRLGGTVGNTTYGIYTSASPDGKGAYLRADVANASGLIYTADSNAANDTLQARISEQLPKLLLAGLQDANLDRVFADYFAKLDLASATEEQVTAAVNAAAAAYEFSSALAALGAQFEPVKGLAVETQLAFAEMVGGVQGATQLLTSFYAQFYTDAERAAMLQQSVGQVFASLDIAVPATRDAFRALVESQDLTTESGRKTWATLMQVAGSFADLVPPSEEAVQAVEDVATAMRSAADIARERAGLERQIMQLSGDTAGLRAAELAALDPSNRALQERIWAIEDEQAAAQKFAAVLSGLNLDTDALARTLQQGMTGALDGAALGQALGDQIAGGIEAALADSFAQQIAAIFTQQIVTPLIQAVIAGNAVAGALSRETLNAAIEQAKAIGQAFRDLSSDPAFTGFLDELRAAFSDAGNAIARTAATAAQTAGSFPLPWLLNGDNTQAASGNLNLDQALALWAADPSNPANATAGGGSSGADRVATERARLEEQLLQLEGNTAELRRRELESLDESNRALQQRIYDLQDAAQAERDAAEAAAAAAQQARAVAAERYGLETQLLTLQGDTTALRRRELEALDPSNRALQQQIYALQDQAAAAADAARQTEAQAAATRAVASERERLETRLLELQGNTAELRRRELAALDPSNRALQEMIWALEDAAPALETVARSAADIAREKYDLETRLLQLEGNTAELRARELAQLDESNRALLERIYALEDEAAAAQAAEQAARQRQAAQDQAAAAAEAARQQVASEREGLQTRLLELEGNTAALRERQLAALDASNRALQQQVWALEDAQAAAKEMAAALTSLVDTLNSNVQDLLGQAGAGLSAAQAQNFLDTALANAQASGYLPDQTELEQAIKAVRESIDATQYATQTEADRARLLLANQLAALAAIAQAQKDALAPTAPLPATPAAAAATPGEQQAQQQAEATAKASADMDGLRAEARAIAQSTAAVLKLLQRVTPDGDAVATREVAA